MDTKGKPVKPHIDGGRSRLVQYLSKLPDGCVNGHLFPQYFYFCSCGKIKEFSCHRSQACEPANIPSQDASCMRSLHYVLRLENIHMDWNDFISDVTAGLVERQSAKHFTGLRLGGPVGKQTRVPVSAHPFPLVLAGTKTYTHIILHETQNSQTRPSGWI